MLLNSYENYELKQKLLGLLISQRILSIEIEKGHHFITCVIEKTRCIWNIKSTCIGQYEWNLHMC